MFLLLPLFAFGSNDDTRLEKRINKEFSIQSDGRVELNNKHGNIDIAIGEDHKVKINVLISATGGSERKVQETLDRITVSFEEGNNRVSAQTEIESTSGWLSWFSTGKSSFDIRYQVWVPADVFLKLSNQYGSIYVETTNRDIDIELAFGNLHLGDINGRLKLDMSYSEGAISQIRDGDMVLAFSDLEMEDGNDMTMDIKYSKVESGTFQKLRLVSANSEFQNISVGTVDYDGKYDDVILEHVSQIDVESSFTGLVIQQLTGESSFEMRYGELEVQNIHRSFNKLNLNSSFTGVELNFMPDASFSVDAETNFCEIEHEGLNVISNIEKTGKRSFQASKGNSDNKVEVRMNYGELWIH